MIAIYRQPVCAPLYCRWEVTDTRSRHVDPSYFHQLSQVYLTSCNLTLPREQWRLFNGYTRDYDPPVTCPSECRAGCELVSRVRRDHIGVLPDSVATFGAWTPSLLPSLLYRTFLGIETIIQRKNKSSQASTRQSASCESSSIDHTCGGRWHTVTSGHIKHTQSHLEGELTRMLLTQALFGAPRSPQCQSMMC